MKHAVVVMLKIDTENPISDNDIIKMKNDIIQEINMHGNRSNFISYEDTIESYEFDTFPGKVEYLSQVLNLYPVKFDIIEEWAKTEEPYDDFIKRVYENKDENIDKGVEL